MVPDEALPSMGKVLALISSRENKITRGAKGLSVHKDDLVMSAALS